ncbi:Innexin [Dictyocaulus viviparus]|uniref:Innexin n=1 Tax=Dictyocaulus viviparus TaxID=29172 RepID=A0A0D8XVG6_DICVI|nr:Innexin [Dictyocaulus viviparus]
MESNTKSHKQSLDDYVDCMHHYLTVYILGLFALLIASKQHFGNPIDCFISPETSNVRSWQAYILNYCFMQDIDMSTIVTESSALNADVCYNRRLSKLKNVADYIFNYFYYRKIAQRSLMNSLFRLPAVVSILYGFTKFLNLFNSILQIFLTTYFLGFPDLHWGVKIMVALLKQSFSISIGSVKKSSSGATSYFPYFPLEVGCNYTKIENNNNLHISSIQCIIPLNYMNEKLFLFLWFWFVILIIITLVNNVVFIASITNKSHREEEVLSLLKINVHKNTFEDEHILAHKFVHHFMGVDGVLLTRFISAKANSFTCRDLLQQVWLKYHGEEGRSKIKSSDDEWSVPFSDNCYSASYYPDDCSTRTSLNN